MSALAAADPLGTPLRRAGLPGGPVVARLRRLGIDTVRDLLFHLPRRYDDLRRPLSLRALLGVPADETVSARATVVELTVEQTWRRHVTRTLATLRDEHGDRAEAIWFGRRFIERRLHEGDRVILTGRVKPRGWVAQFQNPEFGPDEEGALHAGRIVPVYRLTGGVTVTTLRRVIRAALDRYAPLVDDYLPEALLSEQGLVPLAEALEQVHFPDTFPRRDAALRRLAFDELFALQVGMVVRDRLRRPDTARPVPVTDERVDGSIATVERLITERIRARLAASDDEARRAEAPAFEARLTADQVAATAAIRADLAGTRPMLRLLQGDVGSGKTAVAALALAWTADAGRQGALLAPTDLLARQHHDTLRAFLEPLGHEVTLLTGSLAATDRRAALATLAHPGETPAGLLDSDDGTPRPPRTTGRVVVGTHALFQEAVAFDDLGLVVIDEQHRFGVAQRDALAGKGANPHVLLMTATPIPRTLGQVFYADLDVSDLRTQPAGRRPILTGRRRFDELMWRRAARPDGASDDERADRAPGTYPLIAREIAAGHRAFVVVPHVVDDGDGDGTAGLGGGEALAVDEAHARVEAALPEAAVVARVSFARPPRTGIVHGQMRAADRDRVMSAFRAGDLDVLVGTTVIEVGVDVPEATVMAILNADLFGVAQLHQLRGRVGRGEAQSYCVLVSDTVDETATARLRALETISDGFDLAEVDFTLRQAGDLLGEMQSGLPPLRVASLSRPEDLAMSARAREVAANLVDGEGRLDPGLERFRHELEDGWLRRVGAGEALSEAEGDA